MKIDHVALYVKNLEKERALFEKYFGAQSGEKYTNKKSGFQSYFLTLDGETRLELMHRSSYEEPGGNIRRSGYEHIALSVGSAKVVDALTARLLADGYTVLSEPRTTGDGYYESRALDCEGNIIEITV